MLSYSLRTRLASLAAAALLVACGGGGGDSSAGTTGTPTQVLVTGFKGMLSGAVVSVYEMRDGPRGRLLARGPTDANGEFAFRLRNKPANPVMIELSAQSGSTMLDEVNGPMSMPAGMRLRAAVPDISQLAEVHVTPFSDMAAAAVEASGKITPTAIEAANRAVAAQYFEGESILATRPLKVDEIESVSQRPRLALTKALTALVAAVAENVATGETGQACQQADYGERLLCALNGLTKAVEMANDGRVQMAPQFAAPVLTKGFELINSGQVKPKDSKGQPRSFGNERYGEDKIAQFAK